MKLYDVPRRTDIRLLETPRVPPGAPTLAKGDTLFFDHLDGMYSFCSRGACVYHIAAWTEVEPLRRGCCQ